MSRPVPVRNASTRSRRWCLTWNNPTEDDAKAQMAAPVTYQIIGKEGDDKTNHDQGYEEYKSLQSFAQMKARYPRAHIEVARGTSQQAADYCKKEGDWTERGTIMQPQGKRNDIHAVRDMLKDKPTTTLRDILDTHPAVLARYPKFVETVRRCYAAPTTLSWDDAPNVWFYGPAGLGKSRAARASSTSLYVKMANKWWDGYDNEDDVLIDDFHPDQAKYLVSFLKIWADRYPFPAEVKGGTIMIRPARILVTTQYTHNQLFPNGEDIAAIDRRFKNHVFEQ